MTTLRSARSLTPLSSALLTLARGETVSGATTATKGRCAARASQDLQCRVIVRVETVRRILYLPALPLLLWSLRVVGLSG